MGCSKRGKEKTGERRELHTESQSTTPPQHFVSVKNQEKQQQTTTTTNKQQQCKPAEQQRHSLVSSEHFLGLDF